MANTALTGDYSSDFQKLVDLHIEEGKEFRIFSLDKKHIAPDATLGFDGGKLRFSTSTSNFKYYFIELIEGMPDVTLTGELANNAVEGISYKAPRPLPEEEV